MGQELATRQGEQDLRTEIVESMMGPDGKRVPIPLYNGVMSPDKWTFFGRMAQTISDTEFVDKSLRKRPAAIMAALLFGDSLGLHPSASLRDVYVADGTVGMKSELMLALILDAGHNVDFEDLYDEKGEYVGAVATGQRKKRGKVVKTDKWSYTLVDATKAGLYPNQSNRAAWSKVPKVMCRWRALSQLARFLFPDVFRGQAVYIPDELEEIRDKDVRNASRTESVAQIEASIDYGDDPDLAAWLLALFAAANEVEPGKWLPAKIRLTLKEMTDEQRADLAVEIAEWISERGVDPPSKPSVGAQDDAGDDDEPEAVSDADVHIEGEETASESSGEQDTLPVE